jgi:hypothetical protein
MSARPFNERSPSVELAHAELVSGLLSFSAKLASRKRAKVFAVEKTYKKHPQLLFFLKMQKIADFTNAIFALSSIMVVYYEVNSTQSDAFYAMHRPNIDEISQALSRSSNDFVNRMRCVNLVITAAIGRLYLEILIFASYRLQLEIEKKRRLMPPDCED